MTASEPPTTAALNGRLWGTRAHDWAEVQEGQFRAGYEDVFNYLPLTQGAFYCDLGCGAGMAAQMASQRGAHVSGLDAADTLLHIARTRVPAGDFRVGDLEKLPFADGVFDVVTGFNSFQYAANPLLALTEAKRITKPTGRIVVMTWSSPEGMEAASLVQALKPLLPPPPPGAPGPFALSEAAALSDFAAAAGLTPMESREMRCTWQYQNLATALRGLGSSGVAVRAAEHTSQEAVNQAHTAALSPFCRVDGSYHIGAAFRWLVAAV